LASLFFLSVATATAQVDLGKMREKTEKALKKLQTYKADDVLRKIDDTIKKFNEVADKLLSAEPGTEGKYVDELIEFYQAAARNFRDIDSQREKILKETRERRSDLAKMLDETKLEHARLERELRNLESQSLPSDDFKRKVAEDQRAALKALYEQQAEALQYWNDRYEEVIGNAHDIEVAIDRLLYVVHLSVPIYEASAQTLIMNRDLQQAMAIFERQGEIQSLTNEVIASWTRTELLISRALEDLEQLTPLP